MSPEAKLPTRTQAVRMLTEQRAQIDDLLGRFGPRKRTRPGLGGGEWSPKDLVSHLELWERFALDSVAAWERGERSPIDRELWSRSTSAINADGVAAAAHLSWARATRRAEATHAELLALIDGMSDARWRTPATPRARKPFGMRIGQFLAGSTGPFRHDLAHLKDLRAFVAERSER
ncbi:MAG: DinB family protein [Actinomycetota bacterium]